VNKHQEHGFGSLYRISPDRNASKIRKEDSFYQLLTHKIFSCHTIFETSHS